MTRSFSNNDTKLYLSGNLSFWNAKKKLEMAISPYYSFLICLVYRLSSVIFMQTSYAPDEYWQSLEVAHNMVFGYGYLTWEWKQGIRSYTYPFFISIFYKLLKLTYLDNSILIIYVPKILQALFTAISDQCFISLCKQFNFYSYPARISIYTNWFWYYCGFRNLTNTFETALTTMALYYYPWMLFLNKKKSSQSTQLDVKNRTIRYLCLCALNCFVRPTAITIWGPLVLFQLFFTSSKYIKQFFTSLLQAFLIVVPISLAIDIFFYGKFIVPAYNFLYFNIYQGISSFYGTHPFHWYITQGLPIVLGIQYFIFCYGLIIFFKNEFKKLDFPLKNIFRIWFSVIILNVLILSSIPHKEFRFALPLMPLMMLIVVKITSDIFKTLKDKFQFIWVAISLLSFFIPCILFGVFHQRGPLQLMNYLRNEVPSCQPNCNYLFLMPCHSTPLYSYLHVNVSTKFLSCEPPIMSNYYDESEEFFKNPLQWLNSYWDEKKLPSHIAFFDNLENVLSYFLKQKSYTKKTVIFHTVFKRSGLGKYIVVYKKS